MALAASSTARTAFVFSDSSSCLALPKCAGLRLVKPRISSAAITSSSSRFSHRRSSVVIVAEKPQDILAPVGAVTDKTWKELVLDCKDIPVIVDFWAPWCGPCRMIAPIFEELAREYGGRIRCLKLNTDESPDIASQYGIRSIPTVMLFKGGEKKDTVIGAVPKTTLVTTIEKFL